MSLEVSPLVTKVIRVIPVDQDQVVKGRFLHKPLINVGYYH